MRKNDKINILISVLLILGFISLALSILYLSSYLIILSLSFIFWGGILFYVAPSRHVPLLFLNATAESAENNIERVLTEFNLTEKGIYLPPKNLFDPEKSLVFVPKIQKQKLPEPEETRITGLLNINHNGLFLTPLGFALSEIFEHKIGRSFTKTDLSFLEKNLSMLLTEEIGIVENIEIVAQNSKITLIIKGSIFEEDNTETIKFPLTYNALGRLLSSSLACVLAKATGKAIIIENERIIEEEKITKIEYLMVEE